MDFTITKRDPEKPDGIPFENIIALVIIIIVLVTVTFPRMGTSPDFFQCDDRDSFRKIIDPLAPLEDRSRAIDWLEEQKETWYPPVIL